MKDLDCKKCGRCCNKNNIKSFGNAEISFKENGDCIYLENNLCTIYEDRPIECAMYPYFMHIVIKGIEELNYCGFGGFEYQIKRNLCIYEKNDSSLS